MFNSVDFIKGIKALSEFVSIDKKYAEKHQQTVIDCLNDHDDSLKRKVRMYSLDVIWTLIRYSLDVVTCKIPRRSF